MSPWQVLRQLKYLASLARWPGGSASLVVASSSYATAGPIPETRVANAVPLVAFSLGTPTPDDDRPDLIDQEILMTLVVGVQGDPTGESALVGGSRSGGVGASAGRGLAEVAVPLLAALGSLTGADGTPIVVAYSGSPEPVVFDEEAGPAYLQQRFALKVRCTTTDEYPAPSELVVGSPLVGQIPLSWTLSPARFDRYKIRACYASGSTPPATYAAGTAITLASATSTSVTVALAPGTYSVAIFTAYAPFGGASDEFYSDQETGTTRAGIVVS